MTPTYSGEVQFAGYSDSSRSGPRITLRLADRDDLQQFVGMEGKRFACVLVELTDGDELKGAEPAAPAEPPPPAAPAAPEKPKGGRLSRDAALMCNDVGFQRQVREDYPADWGLAWSEGIKPAEQAAQVIRLVCGIQSRADLDHNASAAERFRHCFRLKWLESETGVMP